MKRTVCLLISLSAAFNIFADGRSQEIISRMSSTIKSLGEYRVEFAANADGNTTRGNYVVSGERYFMSSDGVEVICDGRTKYEINHDLQEVIIDAVDPADGSILSNPTKTFDFQSSNMEGTYTGEMRAAGRSCDAISIRFTDGSDTFERIVLLVDKQSSLPVELRYKLRNSSGEVVLTVGMIASEKAEPSLFRFDGTKYRGYEIIDFR